MTSLRFHHTLAVAALPSPSLSARAPAWILPAQAATVGAIKAMYR